MKGESGKVTWFARNAYEKISGSSGYFKVEHKVIVQALVLQPLTGTLRLYNDDIDQIYLKYIRLTRLITQILSCFSFIE